MWKKIKAIFAAPVFKDEEKTLDAWALNIVLLGFIIVQVIAVLALIIRYSSTLSTSIAILLGLTLFHVVLLIILRRGYVRHIQIILLIEILIACFAQTSRMGSIRTAVASSFIVGLLLSSLFGHRRTIILYTLLSIAEIASLSWIEYLGLMKPPESMPPAYASGIIHIGLLIAGSIFLELINHRTRSTMSRLQRKEQALIKSNQALQNLSESLEAQIVERTLNTDEARLEAEEARQTIEIQMWQTIGQSLLNKQMRGEQSLTSLANNVIHQLCQYVDAQVGALYLLQETEPDTYVLRRMGSHAYAHQYDPIDEFALGEGLIGQAALEKQALTLDIPIDDCIVVRSGLGQTLPRQIYTLPFLYEEEVVGVIEIATLNRFDEEQIRFLEAIMENVAIAFHTALARQRIDELLIQTQEQAEELQLQGEEFLAVNEELEIQAEILRNSEMRLREKQVELETTNAELEEKTEALQKSGTILRQKQTVLDQQNQELLLAQKELQRRADELTRISQYKSEFLANVSHELRTPLNSLLILAQMLSENAEDNLNEEQVESASIIYNSGVDLLNLINEILDLSKVESGKMDFHFAEIDPGDILDTMHLQFVHIAKKKELEYELVLAPDAPTSIECDEKRIAQILKNLLANAFKFTEEGKVSFRISRPAPHPILAHLGMEPGEFIAFTVQDTGIGIRQEQQEHIFEAFWQADGSTSRKYGGTGLGLTISRELALSLGGDIVIESEFGKGSTFTLILPVRKGARNNKVQTLPQQDKQASVEEDIESATPEEGTEESRQPEADNEQPVVQDAPQEAVPPPLAVFLPDDRDALAQDDRVLLIVEDDAGFAELLHNYAHKKGFKCLLSGDGKSALSMVTHYKVDAIILDLNIPELNGWDVLKILKDNPETRHIPVHIMSASDVNLDAYQKGAIGFLSKPITRGELEVAFDRITQFVSRDIKSLLLVEDNDDLRHSVTRLLSGDDIHIVEASTGQAALDALKAQNVDCMILDLTLPDISGFELLQRLNNDKTLPKCPVIIYTGKALTPEENQALLKYTDALAQPPRVIIKGIKSPERLLDETALFLHRVVANMAPEKRQTIQRLHDREAMLVDKHVLIVDDDMRSAYALSKLLGTKGLTVSLARSGVKSLEILQSDPSIDLVLMDIMMPGMDGYETIHRIREDPRLRELPILTLTAKAMKGDQEKCIAAGANDYLSKPVDVERLLSMLRVWLYH